MRPVVSCTWCQASKRPTIETRIQILEQQVAALTEQASDVTRSTGKDWRSSVGMLPKDDVSEEADRLGQQWREEQLEP